MDFKKEMQAQGKSLGKAIVDFVLPKSPVMRILLLGSLVVLFLAWLSGGTSADGATLDSGKFCVAASSDGGKFNGKSGNCAATPQAEKFNASFEVGWMCGGTNDPCRDMEIQLSGFSQAPTGYSALSFGGSNYEPVVTGSSISWSVPGGVTSNSGVLYFDFRGTEAQIMAVQEEISSSSGEVAIQVNRNF